jgi:hypothetical protein
MPVVLAGAPQVLPENPDLEGALRWAFLPISAKISW